MWHGRTGNFLDVVPQHNIPRLHQKHVHLLEALALGSVIRLEASAIRHSRENAAKSSHRATQMEHVRRRYWLWTYDN